MNQSEITSDTERARKWFEHNRYHYDYEVEIPGHGKRDMQEVFDELLDLVETSVHLDLLSEAFEHRNNRNNRTNAKDRAPTNPSPRHTPGYSPAPSTSPSSQPTEATK